MKINDTQDQAIWDTINKEHNKLFKMYEERIALEKKHITELDNFVTEIGKQENKVEELAYSMLEKSDRITVHEYRNFVDYDLIPFIRKFIEKEGGR